MTGFWEPGVVPSLLTFLAEPEEEKDLLEEMASLEPRRCFGVESMILQGQLVTPVPCGRKGRAQTRRVVLGF